MSPSLHIIIFYGLHGTGDKTPKTIAPSFFFFFNEKFFYYYGLPGTRDKIIIAKKVRGHFVPWLGIIVFCTLF
jgi:hypothetical protein